MPRSNTSDALRTVDNLKDEVVSWARRVQPSGLQDARYERAFEDIDEALRKTIGYMKRLRGGEPEDERVSHELTLLWQQASRTVSPLDAHLSDALATKGLGWTDPDVWDWAEGQGLEIRIEDMQKARAMLNRKRQSVLDVSKVPGWFAIAGFVFTAATILFLAYLLLGPGIDAGRRRIFNVLIAFCAAASAGFLGGSAAAHGHVPTFKDSPIKFSAVGGVGTFIVTFLILEGTD